MKLRFLVFVAILLCVSTPVLAALTTENFDDQTPPAIPEDDDYTFTSNAACVNSLVSNLQAHSAPNSVRTITGPSTCTTVPNHAYIDFEYTNGFDLCEDDSSFTFWTYMEALPTSGTNVKYLVNGGISQVGGGGSDSVYIQVNNVGEVTVQVSSSISKTLLGVTFPINTWVDFTMAAADCDVGETDGATFSSNALVFVQRLQHVSAQNIMAPLNHFQVFDSVLNHVTFVDDLTLPAEIDAEQYPVNTLVGYSMDSSGRNIITRETGGTVVKTYAATAVDEGPTGTFATPNCNRFDGVVTMELRNQLFTSFVDCDSVNNRVEAVRIRSASLGTPPFDPSCTEAQENIDDGDFVFDFNVPNNMRDIGTLSDVAFDYRVCTSSGTNHAAAVWTFSTLNDPAGSGGYIGLFGVVFNNLGTNDNDVTTVQLDTSPLPEITQFCSWRSQTDGRDYVGGVTQNGPTGFYEGTATLSGAGAENIQVDLNEVFVNSGAYANALGVSCSGPAILLGFEDRIVEYQGIVEGEPSVTTTSISGGVLRGVAMSGDGNFIAWVDGPVIKVGHAGNHSVTVELELPSGVWRGMEFDDIGQTLAVFTSDFITVFAVSPYTCELTVCEGGAGDDGESDIPGDGDGEDGEGGGISGNGLLNISAEMGVYLTLGTIIGFAIFGYALTTGRRRDE